MLSSSHQTKHVGGSSRCRLWFLCLLPGLLVAGCGSPNRAADTLIVWHPWGGTMRDRFDRTLRAFEESHPGVKVRGVFTSNDLATNQKFFTAVAAGRPPDITFVDGPQVAEWAERGALTALDQRLRAAGIAEADFYGPCWRQNHYRDHVWALTFCADPNFGFVWNKQVFRDVGLDPEKPPTTIAELDAYSDRITRIEGGKMVRIGIIPWGIYGSANSMFTWGWAFGGEFYDYDKQRITADNPQVVEALQWMTSYAEKYDATRIASLQAGFGTAEHNPFYVGQLGMTCLHIGGIEEIKLYAPNLDFGIGYIPAPPDGEPHSSWVGGWCVAIPKGSPHPQQAWEFARWVCADPEGTAVVGRETGLFPGYRPSPYFAEVRDKPYYGVFLKILEECRHQRPVMPAQGYYMGALERAVGAAVYGEATPEQALREARELTQFELDEALLGT